MYVLRPKCPFPTAARSTGESQNVVFLCVEQRHQSSHSTSLFFSLCLPTKTARLTIYIIVRVRSRVINRAPRRMRCDRVQPTRRKMGGEIGEKARVVTNGPRKKWKRKERMIILRAVNNRKPGEKRFSNLFLVFSSFIYLFRIESTG